MNIEYRNPEYCLGKDNYGEWTTCKRLIVELFLDGEWVNYCLDPEDKYAPFNTKELFDKIVSENNLCPCKIPTEEELLIVNRNNMFKSRYEFKKALINNNYYDNAKILIDSASSIIQLAWNEKDNINRKDELVLYIQSNLNLSDTDIDKLFI